MKILVIQDSFVSGTPVFAGEVLGLNQTVEYPPNRLITVGKSDLSNLTLANRVVEYDAEDESHAALVEERAKANARIAAEAAAAIKNKKSKKSASAANQTEGN